MRILSLLSLLLGSLVLIGCRGEENKVSFNNYDSFYMSYYGNEDYPFPSSLFTCTGWKQSDLEKEFGSLYKIAVRQYSVESSFIDGSLLYLSSQQSPSSAAGIFQIVFMNNQLTQFRNAKEIVRESFRLSPEQMLAFVKRQRVYIKQYKNYSEISSCLNMYDKLLSDWYPDNINKK